MLSALKDKNCFVIGRLLARKKAFWVSMIVGDEQNNIVNWMIALGQKKRQKCEE
jgi:hypothetical protein